MALPNVVRRGALGESANHRHEGIIDRTLSHCEQGSSEAGLEER